MQTNPRAQQYARAVWQAHIDYNIAQLPNYSDLIEGYRSDSTAIDYIKEMEEEIPNFKDRLYDRERPQRTLTESQVWQEASKGKLANFGNCLVTNMNFAGGDFAEAVFTMATFVNCNFERCQMQRCELSEVQFINCNLKGVIV
jgi:hypothetical protein